MKKPLGIIFFILFSFLFFGLSKAATDPVWSANSTGGEKNVFYSNETVYVNSVTVAPAGTPIRIYIVVDNNDWANGTALTGVITPVDTLTDVYSHVPLMSIWSPPLTVGKYDIVVNINRTDVYTNGTCGSSPFPDCIDNTTMTGFEVLEGFYPTGNLSVSAGSSNPSDHNWYWDLNATPYNSMLQIMLTNNANENVNVSSISLAANGTGNDKTGVAKVDLVIDANNDGIYNTEDTLLSSGKYLRDDGILILDIPNGYVINNGTSVNVLVVYEMTNASSIGDTYSFQLIAIIATGTISGRQVTVTKLPMNSAVKTTIAKPAGTTTTAATTTRIGTIIDACEICSVVSNSSRPHGL